MNFKRPIFLIILVFLTVSLNAQSLRLKVENESKNPISNASVSSGNKIIGTTNKSGEVSILSSEIQNNTVSITASEYEPFVHVFSNLQEKNIVSIVLISENKLQEVVITAGRKQENIATVPSSITIMSQKEIQVQSSINTNLSSILGNVIPGLGTSTNKATNSGQTLRGRQVLVLIDGIPQSTPLMNGARDIRVVDANAIERIEVIKGATSIYGNGSGGGIINYITKKSPLVDSFQGITTVGTTFNPLHGKETFGYRVSQFFNGRKNKFSYVIGGAFDYTGLQRDADGRPLGQTDGLSNSSQSNAFVKLGYDMDEHTSFNVVYNFYSSTQNAKYISQTGVYGQTPTIGVRGTEPGKNAGTPFNHNFMFTFSKNNLFNSTQLDVSAYLNSFQSMNRYVASATAWYGPGQTMINSNKNGTRINLNTPFTIASMASEITYGIDVLNDVTFQDLVDGRVYIPKMDMLNIAPYAQLKVDVLENLIFKGGLRYENATVRVDDYNTIASGPGNQGSIFVEGGKIPYNATMFNAGLRFNKYEIFNPFVSFSQAFAINELGRILRSAEESTIASLATDPIITNNYEAGFSSKFYNFNLTAAYYISTSKLGANLIEVDGRLVAQREPEKIKGYEITLDYRFSDKLNVGGSYSYVDGKAEFDDGSTVYLNGSRIAPPKATGFINYKPTSDWFLQLSWVNTGCRNRFEPNTNGRYNNSEGPISTVNLINFAGSYAFNKNWSLNLGVENLLNNSYYSTLSQYRAVNADYVMGSGMTTSLNLRYKF
ncbi:TonB-dependent receptor [Flavobacterium phragmitis]|uniref:Iron complex outermembrane recepter protein n=1 Tax=Flavobacterium phragmitis TaxID=739143 RepID=A0A1I1WMG9_9FLAO|nr:TonB-dependent receptor [Flavobacterium phragmitis]SFD95588.1 iron complex outermembrane recepter protein [Flavobacterium phragmitis]